MLKRLFLGCLLAIVVLNFTPVTLPEPLQAIMTQLNLLLVSVLLCIGTAIIAPYWVTGLAVITIAGWLYYDSQSGIYVGTGLNQEKGTRVIIVTGSQEE